MQGSWARWGHVVRSKPLKRLWNPFKKLVGKIGYGRRMELWRMVMVGILTTVLWAAPIRADAGLRMKLKHWAAPDSPLAAFYPSLHHRMQYIVNQSRSRAQAFAAAASTGSYQSHLSPFGGGYTMDITVGNPGQSFRAVADTGSDLVWFQADPCSLCGTIIFYPSRSSTYKSVPCNSSLCSKLKKSSCGPQSTCRYTYSYGSGQTSGQLVTESLSLPTTSGSAQRFYNFAIGNGNSNYGLHSFQGIVGLGQGALSLTSQLSPNISSKFSYCLVDITNSSFSSPLFFGASAVITNSDVQSTPIVHSSTYPSYYIVDVQNMLLNGNPFGSPGITVLDSGTTLTYLPTSMYISMVIALRLSVDLPLAFNSESGLDLCYNKASKRNYKFPSLTIKFNGATFNPPSSNYFASFDEDTNIVCLAMASTNGLPVSIIGNLMQQNYQFLYDRGNSLVSFAPANCVSM